MSAVRDSVEPRVLVLGAGGTGGYFGGRLAQGGADVTVLVRPARGAQLERDGLRLRSPRGDADLAVAWTTADALPDAVAANGGFDLVLLSCKAYDLDSAVDAIAPAVGAQTAVLPVLNGLRHYPALDARFGRERVIGGLCFISSTLDEAGHVIHLNDSHTLILGELGGGMTPRIDAIFAELSRGNFIVQSSADVMQDLWEKWTFIATLGALTSLMRAAVGDVVASGGTPIAEALLEECSAIAARNGHAPRQASTERSRRFLTTPGSTLQASMAKDIERGARIEADHIVGDLLERGRSGDGAGSSRDWPVLRLAYAALKAYEARRLREAAA